MSDASHLPENLADWPLDPYKLLGVARNVDKRELRRAYHQLLRRFKPEHAPEEFRRVREAYETVSRHVELRDLYELSETGSSDDERPETSAAGYRSLASLTVDAPAAAWNAGIGDDLTLLYSQLRKLLPTTYDDWTLYARLFWLLHVEPSIDQDATAADWLVTGLSTQTINAGSLPELYRRLLKRQPDEALTSRFEKLIAAFDNRPLPHWLPRLLEVRWRAVREKQRWMPIVLDIEQLGLGYRGFEDRSIVWQLLSTAVRELWLVTENDAAEGANSVLHLLESQFGADHQYFHPLASLDGREFSQAWVKANWTAESRYQVDLLELLVLTDVSDGEEVRFALLELLSRKHAKHLYIELLRLAAIWPSLLNEFSSVLDQAEAYSHPTEQTSWSDALLHHQLKALVDSAGDPINSRNFELKLLNFCLDNWLLPTELVTSLYQTRNWKGLASELIKAIEGNFALLLTCRAYRLLQG